MKKIYKPIDIDQYPREWFEEDTTPNYTGTEEGSNVEPPKTEDKTVENATTPEVETTPEVNNATYVPNEAATNAQANLNSYIEANQPNAYDAKWNTQLDSIMNQILNREKFTYDMNSDAIYNQYKDIYQQQADMANKEAQAQAAALTGGYSSSYGQMLGQQAYGAEMQKLNNIVPDLYQNALNQYLAEGDELYNQLGTVASMEAQDYARYQNELNNYYANRDYLTNRADIESQRSYNEWLNNQSQGNWQAEFDRAGQQWEALYGKDGLYNKTTPTTGIYNQGGTLQGQEVPLSLQDRKSVV